MKIFNQIENFDTKVNFIDENNLALGYDKRQQCCENAGWFIAKEPQKNTTGLWELVEIKNITLEDETIDVSDYRFDPSYFKEEVGNDYDKYGLAIFRIVNSVGEEMFIHLYNHHNGYYSHGFEFQSGEEILHEGMI